MLTTNGARSTAPKYGAVVLGSLLGLLTGFGAAGASVDQRTGSRVPVTLTEWKLVPRSASVLAGRVSFRVTNAGSLEHEFLVVRTERHHHALPTKRGRAVEAGAQGEIDELQPGETRALTLRLRRGKYVLLCNLLGHYKAGQYAAFRVR